MIPAELKNFYRTACRSGLAADAEPGAGIDVSGAIIGLGETDGSKNRLVLCQLGFAAQASAGASHARTKPQRGWSDFDISAEREGKGGETDESRTRHGFFAVG